MQSLKFFATLNASLFRGGSIVINPLYTRTPERFSLDFSTKKNKKLPASRKSQNKFPGVSLHEFLDQKTFKEFQQAVLRSRFSKQCVYDKYFFYSALVPKKVLSFLSSDEFLSFVSTILNVKSATLTVESARCYQFGHRNYTLLHDDTLSESFAEFIFDFTPEWNKSWGGAITYVAPTFAASPESRTSESSASSVFTLPCAQNTATIIKTQTTHHSTSENSFWQRYVQYVNHHSGENKRYFLLATLTK